MNLLISVLIFFYGTLFGSFLNVVILRLPEEEKLTGRSHCVKCRHVLSSLDLIPIFSWLFLGGKCRYCKHKISPRYWIVEIISGLLFVFSWLYLHPTGILGFVILFKYLIALLILLAVFIIDFEHYLILDSIIFPGIAAVSILNLVLDIFGLHTFFSLHSYFLGGFLAAFGGALPFFLVWYFSRGEWMGFGDVKLGLFLGVVLGWPQIFVGLMLGILSGGAVSSVLLIFSSKTLKSQIPFGTFLSLGTVLALFYGDKILQWYLAVLGF